MSEPQGAPSEGLTPDPQRDLGAFKAFKRADGGRVYVGPSGELNAQSPDWSAFLQAGPPDEVAARLAYGLNRGMTEVLRPGEPTGGEVSEAEWALVTAPSLEAQAEGGWLFTAWMAHPPSFGPFRYQARVDADGAATFTQTNASDLLSPEERLGEAMQRLESGGSWEVKAAAQELGEAKHAPAVPALVGALGHDWADARKAAAKALGQIGGEAAISGLEAAALAEGERGVVLDELRALDAIGTPEARAALGRLAEAHGDEIVRARAGALSRK